MNVDCSTVENQMTEKKEIPPLYIRRNVCEKNTKLTITDVGLNTLN